MSRLIVPCGTILNFFTLFVGQPTIAAQIHNFVVKGILIEAKLLTLGRWIPGDSFHVEQSNRSLTT